ncbi:MAG: NADH-quinone oxidoreductase subunit NuoE [Elusimicrobiota bacterium]|jgi:NADH-quinone oxidoreductase subunit E
MKLSLDRIVAKYPNAARSALIPMLQDVQANVGYVSREAMQRIARHLGLSTVKVFGVASFYNQFRFQAPGRFVIQVCRGTACHVKGSLRLLQNLQRELKVLPGQTTRDGVFTLEVVACIGACGLAPVICVNGEFHAGVTPEKLPKILAQYRKQAEAA